MEKRWFRMIAILAKPWISFLVGYISSTDHLVYRILFWGNNMAVSAHTLNNLLFFKTITNHLGV